MYDVTADFPITQLRQRLFLLRETIRIIDLAPLIPIIQKKLEDANRKARLAGLDRDGGYLIDILPQTWARRKRRGYGGGQGSMSGNGPPLDPAHDLSRVVTNFVADVRTAGIGNKVKIAVGWRGMPWLKYHREGIGKHGWPIAVRDISGVPKEVHDEIMKIVRRYARAVAKAVLDGEADHEAAGLAAIKGM